MTTERKDHLRRVMTLAWGLFREPSERRTFSEALRGAWCFMAKLAKPCRLARQLRAGGLVQIKDTLRSPIRQRHGSRATVGGRGSMVYLAARVGA